jgi:hypothetical protein
MWYGPATDGSHKRWCVELIEAHSGWQFRRRAGYVPSADVVQRDWRGIQDNHFVTLGAQMREKLVIAASISRSPSRQIGKEYAHF